MMTTHITIMISTPITMMIAIIMVMIRAIRCPAMSMSGVKHAAARASAMERSGASGRDARTPTYASLVHRGSSRAKASLM